MVFIIFLAVTLVALTVLVHGVGFAVLMRYLLGRRDFFSNQPWRVSFMLIGISIFLAFLHVIAISIWAYAYLWLGCLPDAESAIYFSGVTYTTIGFGDIVPEKPWRFLAPLEGVTGVISGGVSAAFFFLVLQRVHIGRFNPSSKMNP